MTFTCVSIISVQAASALPRLENGVDDFVSKRKSSKLSTIATFRNSWRVSLHKNLSWSKHWRALTVDLDLELELELELEWLVFDPRVALLAFRPDKGLYQVVASMRSTQWQLSP